MWVPGMTSPANSTGVDPQVAHEEHVAAGGGFRSRADVGFQCVLAPGVLG